MKQAALHPFVTRESKKQAIIRWIYMPLLILFAPLVIVVRIVLVLISFTIFGFAAKLVNYHSNYPAPLSPLRFKISKYIMNAVGRVFLLILGQFATYKGTFDKKARVVVANHQSLLDSFVGSRKFPGHTVAKHSLLNFWALRELFKMTRSVIIKREGEEVKQEVKDTLAKKGTEQMKQLIDNNQDHLVIFPEGTVAGPGSMMRFRTSAFTLGQPVYPVTFQYHQLLSPVWTTHHWAVAVFNLIANPFGHSTTTFHPPMAKLENEDFQQFADRVGKYMADFVGYEYTQYQSQDFVYFKSGKGTPTEEYQKDFGWMGTAEQFCKKYKVNQYFGIKSWQVEGIVPVEGEEIDGKKQE